MWNSLKGTNLIVFWQDVHVNYVAWRAASKPVLGGGFNRWLIYFQWVEATTQPPEEKLKQDF